MDTENPKTAIEYIHSLGRFSGKPGLHRIKALCEALGNPQDRLKFVHLAGTNGKGSTACMIASALQAAGYNKDGGKTIPVFGVDATDSAKDAIKNGSMTGSIKQDAEGMAKVISTIAQNFVNGKDTFDGVNADDKVGNWRVNIPYETYTGK